MATLRAFSELACPCVLYGRDPKLDSFNFYCIAISGRFGKDEEHIPISEYFLMSWCGVAHPMCRNFLKYQSGIPNLVGKKKAKKGKFMNE